MELHKEMKERAAEPLILHIETGGDICSVAVSSGNKLLSIIDKTGRDHSGHLSPIIDQMLQELHLSYTQLNALSFSMGPGSYTGLRIGLATAKGICYGVGIPLIGIDSLLSLSYLCGQEILTEGTLICPMIDARRLEVYTCVLDCNRKTITSTQAKILDESSFADLLPDHQIVFLGSGAAKFKELTNHPNAHFVDLTASARGLMQPALEAYLQKDFQNTAYCEPLYLKDFVVTTKKTN